MELVDKEFQRQLNKRKRDKAFMRKIKRSVKRHKRINERLKDE